MQRAGSRQHRPAVPSQGHPFHEPASSGAAGVHLPPAHSGGVSGTSSGSTPHASGGVGNGLDGQQPYIVMTPQMLQMLLQQHQPPPPTAQPPPMCQPEKTGHQPPSAPTFYDEWPGSLGRQLSTPPSALLGPNAVSPSPQGAPTAPSYPPPAFGGSQDPASFLHLAHAQPGTPPHTTGPYQPLSQRGFEAAMEGTRGQSPLSQGVPAHYNPFSTAPSTAANVLPQSSANPGPSLGVSAYYLTEADARRMGLLNAPAPAASFPGVPPSVPPLTTTQSPLPTPPYYGAGGAASHRRGRGGHLSAASTAQLPPPPLPPAMPQESLLNRVAGVTPPPPGTVPYSTAAPTASLFFPPGQAYSSPPPPPPPPSRTAAHAASTEPTGATASSGDNGTGFTVGGWYEGIIKRYNPQRGYGFIKGCYRLAIDAQDCEEACTAYVEDDHFMKGLVPRSPRAGEGDAAGDGDGRNDARTAKDLPGTASSAAVDAASVVQPDESAAAAASPLSHERGSAVLSMMQWYLHSRIGSGFPDGETGDKAPAPSHEAKLPHAGTTHMSSTLREVKPNAVVDTCSPFIKRIGLAERGCDIFIHHSCISLDNFRALPTYTVVRFCVAEVMGTVQAVDAVPLGPSWSRKTVHMPTAPTDGEQQGHGDTADTPSHGGVNASATGEKAPQADADLRASPPALLPPLCTISPAAQALLQQHQSLADLARTAGPEAAAARGTPTRAVLPSAAVPNALQSLSELEASSTAPSVVFAPWRFPARTTITDGDTAHTITAGQQKLQTAMAGKSARNNKSDGTNSGADGLTSAAGMTSSKNITSSASPTATGSGGRAMTTTTQDKSSSNGLPTSGTDPTTGSSGNGSGPQQDSSEGTSGLNGAPNTSSKPDTDSNVGDSDPLSPGAAAELNADDRSAQGINSLRSSVPAMAVVPTSSGTPAAMPSDARSPATGHGTTKRTGASSPRAAVAGAVEHGANDKGHAQTPHRHPARVDDMPGMAPKQTTALPRQADGDKAGKAHASSPDRPRGRKQHAPRHGHGSEEEGSSSSGSGDRDSGSSGTGTGNTVTTTTLSSNHIPDSLPGEVADWTDVFEAKMANERAKDILLHKKDIRFFPHQSAAAKEAAEAAAAATSTSKWPGAGTGKVPTEVIPLSAVGELDSSSSRGTQHDGGSQPEAHRPGRSRGASRSRGGSRQRRDELHGRSRRPEARADDEGTPTSEEPQSASGGEASSPDTGPSQISDARTNDSSGRAGGLPPLVMVPVSQLPAKLARQVPEGVPLIALAREMAGKLGIHVSPTARAAATAPRSGEKRGTPGTAGVIGQGAPKQASTPARASAYPRDPSRKSWGSIGGGVVRVSPGAASPLYSSGVGGTSGYGSGTSPESLGSHPARFVFDFKGNDLFPQCPPNLPGSPPPFGVVGGEQTSHRSFSSRPDRLGYRRQHSPWPSAMSEPLKPAFMWAGPPNGSPRGAQLGMSSASSLPPGHTHAAHESVAQLREVLYDPARGATLNGHRLPLFSTPRERKPVNEIQLATPPWKK